MTPGWNSRPTTKLRILNLARAIPFRRQPLAALAARFGAVGACAAVVDIGLFNTIAHDGVRPVFAKAASTSVGITVAFVGNRTWVFRDRARRGVRREYTRFFLLNLVGLGICEACLWVSYDLLRYRSLLASNISTNVIGLIIASLFRIYAYHRWVFVALPTPALDQEAGTLRDTTRVALDPAS